MGHLIGVISSIDTVTASPSVQHIITTGTQQHIVASASGKRVGNRTTGQGVSTITSGKRHGATELAGIDRVVTGTTGQIRRFNSDQHIATFSGQLDVDQGLIGIDRLNDLIGPSTPIEGIVTGTT